MGASGDTDFGMGSEQMILPSMLSCTVPSNRYILSMAHVPQFQPRTNSDPKTMKEG
eukprot:m.74077 g.74077  ORF g.74077 m.74077 type:complete len:56 (+) comp10267_c0_seq1:2030-2197(+)